ncbi:hypothetical protein [Massilibacteroides sp.]|uniref:hypothetical protein n=1 Tax=Massilibacteroides sp. TaxID=2034766 RepID=UPI0026017080|nr:hypothetical protein [Massilibacteroides sp.]MDD4515401.1 hypothetical protein [Massilibacteroides sp.]
MKYIASLQNIAILLLIGLLFLQRECSRPEPQQPTHSKTEVWHYDTTHYVYKIGIPYPVEKLVPVEIPANVDTAAILQEFFSRNVYHRVLKDDSLAMIALQDTVSRNSLGRATLIYENRRPTQIITNITTYADPVNKVFVGPAVGANLEGDFMLGASALLVTRRDNAYQLTVDPFNKGLTTAAYWKIKLRKRR